MRLSEHAILRYFERVVGIDTDAIKPLIFTEDMMELIETLGGEKGKYPHKDGFMVVIKDNVVVTIV